LNCYFNFIPGWGFMKVENGFRDDILTVSAILILLFIYEHI